MARYDRDISEKRLHGKANPSITTTKGLSVITTPAIDDFANEIGRAHV